MNAELVMTPEQIAADHDGWLRERRKGLTASRMPSVVNVAPPKWDGPYDLWWKLARGEEGDDSGRMRRGRALEPIVLDDFADARPGLVLLPGGLYRRKDAPWQMATFDGQACEADTWALVDGWPSRTGVLPDALADQDVAPVQAKTSGTHHDYGWQEDSREIPVYYWVQAMWEMHVRGAARVFVAVKFLDDWDNVAIYELPRNEEAEAGIAWMVTVAEEFMHRLIVGDPPPVDWRPSTTRTLRKIFPGLEDRSVRIPVALARRYRAVLKAQAELDRRAGLVRNELLERAGNATVIVAIDHVAGQRRDGWMVRVATRSASPVKGHWIEGKDRVDRLNPCGWAQNRRRHG